MGKFLRDHPISGAALYAGPFITLIGFVMDAFHMAEILPPPIIEGIGATAFFLAIIGILNKWYRDAISPAQATSRARSSRSLKQALGQATTNETDASASLFRAIVIGVALLGAFFGVLGMYVVYRYAEYRDAINNTRLDIAQVVPIPPDAPRPPNASPGLFVNIFALTHRFYPTVGPRWGTKFEYPPAALSQQDEDKIMKIVDAGIAAPTRNGPEDYPGSGSGVWTSAYDQKFTTDEWKEVLSGQKYAYLFIQVNYFVQDKIRVTEHCLYFGQDFPSAHRCLGHNRVYTRG